MSAERKLPIVVIDDDPVSTSIAAAALSEQWLVESCPDGASGLRACAAATVGAVVLDIDMPGMDGKAVCRHLRAEARTADLPVIFVSGAGGLDARLACYAAGGDDFLAKPFDPRELKRKVARAIAGRQRHLALAEQIDGLMQSAMRSAEMAGDAVLILEFQHHVAECDTEPGVARLLIDVLAGLGLEACVGPRAAASFPPVDTRGPASALDMATLAQLAASADAASPLGLGPHAGWRSDRLLLLVRDLALDSVTPGRERADRVTRHVDTVGRLLHAADRQLQTIEARRVRAQLAQSREIASLARRALVSAAEHRQLQRQLVERLARTVQEALVPLGLAPAGPLGDVLRHHQHALQMCLDADLAMDRQLSDAVRQLEQAP